MVPCGSSPVTRFALASAMRKTKRLRRRLSITALFMWVDINTQKRNKLYMLSKIWKQRQTTHKFSRKIFRNPGNCWISEMQTIQSEMMEIPGPIKERKLPRKKKFENWCIPREVVLFYGNFGKNCSIRYWKLPKIQTGCLAWMEGAQLFSGQTTYLNYECTAVRPGWKRIATLNKMRHVFQGCPVSSKNDQEPIMLCFFLIESLGVFLVEFQRDDWNHYLGRVPLTLCRKKNK